jgi:AcrR family transcriptional regulator
VVNVTLRADAERNRARIVAAAREVFAERGLDAPMEEVARRSGVGVATLYRRFPTRDDLITGAFGAKMTAYADAVEAALAEPDPWTGFRRFVERIAAMQVADRGFTGVLTRTFPQCKEFDAEQARADTGFTHLVERARAAGKLRADFVPQDVVLLLMANAGVVSATGDAAPRASRRLVAYLLQAFAAEHAQPLPPPPGRRQLRNAMGCLPPRGC